jgi:acyl dehydratase
MGIELFPAGEVQVGRDVAGRTAIAGADDVARYVAGTGDDHAWYRGPSALGGALAPALLFHSEVYRDLSWYLPNLIGNLHAKQEWDLFAPIHVGDAVRTRSTVVGRYHKRGRDYVVNEVLITDPDGRWLQRSRTHQSFLADLPPGDALVVDKDRERRGDRRFDAPAGGAALAPIERRVTVPMCEAFSGPARNYHTDREMARALGFPDIVVQGMWSICLLSELMTREFGLGWLSGGALAVNLVNVLWAEQTSIANGRVRDQRREGSRTRVELDLWCEKTDGTNTVIGTASAVR